MRIPLSARAVLTAMLAALPALAVASPAFAHAVLIGSTPALNGTAATGPTTIDLRYNSRIDRGRSTMTLTAPDGQATRLTVSRDGPEDRLDGPATLSEPGAYNVRWQVLAVDGHITRGDVPFTVKAPQGTHPATP